jgi:transcriptional regulator with XRE-family HTH domain
MPEPKPSNLTFKNAIRTYRLLLGLHQWQLGERLGATQSQVSAWENGDIVPDLNKAIEIAVTLGRPVEHLFFDHYLAATDRAVERQVRPGQADLVTS